MFKILLCYDYSGYFYFFTGFYFHKIHAACKFTYI